MIPSAIDRNRRYLFVAVTAVITTPAAERISSSNRRQTRNWPANERNVTANWRRKNANGSKHNSSNNRHSRPKLSSSTNSNRPRQLPPHKQPNSTENLPAVVPVATQAIHHRSNLPSSRTSNRIRIRPRYDNSRNTRGHTLASGSLTTSRTSRASWVLHGWNRTGWSTTG